MNDDDIDEADETIQIVLSDPENSYATLGLKSTMTITITDNDDPVRYSFANSNTTNAPGTSGTEDATPSFRVYLLDPVDQTEILQSGKDLTINWTMDLTGGDDDDTEA